MRCDGHADFVAADRSRITLATLAPVDFHVIGPGLHAVVPPKRVTQLRPRTVIESGPLPHPGTRSIRTHNPAGTNEVVA